jgi:hypothetical protein
VSTDSDNPIALKWSARFFFAVGVAAALFCAYSVIGTVRFISERTRAEGTVVDWTQGRTTRSEPGAYFRIIEIETPNGQRIRGQAEVGVDMRRLDIGERVGALPGQRSDAHAGRLPIRSLDRRVGDWRNRDYVWSGRLVSHGAGTKCL